MNLVKELPKVYEFQSDWDNIKDKIIWTSGNKRQVAVQHSIYCTDVYHDRCVKIKNMPGLEIEYNIINPLFKDTIFEQILNDYDGYGARFAVMDPLTLYSTHIDPAPRIHLAIDTDDYNMFLFPTHNKIYKIPSNNHLYYVNTTEYHSFVNTSKNKKRIHFFFISDKVNENETWNINPKAQWYAKYK